MRTWLGSSLGLLVLGCASGGAVDPPIAAVDDSVVESPPPTVPEPEPIPAVEREPRQVLVFEECASAAKLAEAGEHKVAVDEYAALLEAGVDCDPAIVDRVESSRRVLSVADDLIRRGLAARDASDFESARRRFEEARAVYPKYYWIEALEDELESRAAAATEGGEPAAKSDGSVAAGRFDEALRALNAANGLTEYLDSQIAELKDELGGARLAAAQRAQRAGDLELATELVLSALAIDPVEPVRSRAIEFSRRLGLTHFSAGELERARSLWLAAMALDSDNELLGEYIEEVEARLRSLDAIKKERGE